MRILARRLLALAIGIAVVISYAAPETALAIQSENDPPCTEKRLRDLGVLIVNCNGNITCSSSTGAIVPTGGGTGGALYMIGDSITEGSVNELRVAFNGRGFTPIINGKASRRLSTGSSELDGQSVLEKDLQDPQIQNASVVVVELGTNSGLTTGSVEKAIASIKASATKAKIFWVNLGVVNSLRERGGLDFTASNNILSNNKDIAVIDWASSIKPELVANDGLGVHPSSGKGREVFANTVASGISGGGASVSGGCTGQKLPGNNDAEKVWNFFVGKNWPVERIAGVMGNMAAESGITAMRMQGVYNRTVSSRDVDINSGLGYGVVQWTPVRKLIATATEAGVAYEEIDTIEFQLEFLWNQLQGTAWRGNPKNLSSEKSAGNIINQANTIEEAAIAFAVKYERCADCQSASSGSTQNRIRLAQDILVKYSSGVPR